MNTFRASLPCAGMAGSAVPPLTAAGQPIIVCGAPAQSRPGSQYEDKWLPGRTHGDQAAHSQSPGCSSTLFRWPSFSRRQAVGVVAYLNTGTLTANQILGAIIRLPRSLFSHAPAQVCQDRRRCVSKKYPVLFVFGFHARNKAWRRKHGLLEKSASGA
jgi:hypothetical protein